ncbi:MAG: endolytic transglycosylase MltG [Geminicoccaceae bacterium]
MPRWLRLLAVGAGVLVVLATVAAAGAFWWASDYLTAPGPLATPRTVELPLGTGVGGIAARLAAAGAIEHPRAFALLARLTRRDRALRAGEYKLEPGMSPDAILTLLESGKIVLHPIAVPEGLTVNEVLALVGAADVLTGELPPAPPEGTLLPDTWLVPRGETRTDVVERMHAAMSEELTRVWATRQPDLPVQTPEQVLTLASIIEKETAVPAEYPLVAAVFVNRLRKGMPLQTDPTVIYALADGKGPLGRELTRADLQVDHPYTTYRNPGLPPGPIANPGRAALAAAVAPADVDYLYFVADGSGGHAFATTLAEHNRNVAKWRKLRRDNG